AGPVAYPVLADTCGVHQDVFSELASLVVESNSSSNEQLHWPPPGLAGNDSPPQLLAESAVALSRGGAAEAGTIASIASITAASVAAIRRDRFASRSAILRASC